MGRILRRVPGYDCYKKVGLNAVMIMMEKIVPSGVLAVVSMRTKRGNPLEVAGQRMNSRVGRCVLIDRISTSNMAKV